MTRATCNAGVAAIGSVEAWKSSRWDYAPITFHEQFKYSSVCILIKYKIEKDALLKLCNFCNCRRSKHGEKKKYIYIYI